MKKVKYKGWIIALSLLVLIGGGYLLYNQYIEDEDHSDEVAAEEEQVCDFEELFGYWMGESSVLYIEEEYLVQENTISEGNPRVYEILNREIDGAEVFLELRNIYDYEEENIHIAQIRINDDGDSIESKLSEEDVNVVEYESISEEDYFNNGGTNLAEYLDERLAALAEREEQFANLQDIINLSNREGFYVSEDFETDSPTESPAFIYLGEEYIGYTLLHAEGVPFVGEVLDSEVSNETITVQTRFPQVDYWELDYDGEVEWVEQEIVFSYRMDFTSGHFFIEEVEGLDETGYDYTTFSEYPSITDAEFSELMEQYSYGDTLDPFEPMYNMMTQMVEGETPVEEQDSEAVAESTDQEDRLRYSIWGTYRHELEDQPNQIFTISLIDANDPEAEMYGDTLDLVGIFREDFQISEGRGQSRVYEIFFAYYDEVDRQVTFEMGHSDVNSPIETALFDVLDNGDLIRLDTLEPQHYERID